jgi:hypothetical protein
MRFKLLAAAAAALSAALPAAALDLPTRKPGLWEIKMVMEGGPGVPPQVTQQCVDATTDKEMNALGTSVAKDKCSRQDISKSGGTFIVDAECQIGPVKATTRSEATGSFDSAYTVKVNTRMDGAIAPGMPSGMTTKMTIEAKWLGACKPDQKPGDIVMPNGTKMNILDIKKMQGRVPGAMPAR